MVELLAEKNCNKTNSVATLVPNADPITMLLMLPIMPVILIMQLHMAMMQQLSQTSPVQQTRTKITSITRNGNTLDIIEKWI